MTKVDSFGGYDFYIGTRVTTGGGRLAEYNIVPAGSAAPASGYLSRPYIEKIKGVKFPDRYQPTLHGTRETYTDSFSG